MAFTRTRNGSFCGTKYITVLMYLLSCIHMSPFLTFERTGGIEGKEFVHTSNLHCFFFQIVSLYTFYIHSSSAVSAVYFLHFAIDLTNFAWNHLKREYAGPFSACLLLLMRKAKLVPRKRKKNEYKTQ